MNAHTLPNTQDVFTAVHARPAHTITGEHPSLVHLRWSAPAARLGDRVTQVYVDGVLAAVSSTPSQRELWLVIDRSRPRRIELLAVAASPGDARWKPCPRDLRSWPELKSVVSLTIARDARLPVDARVGVAIDGRSAAWAPIWPTREHRAGFGALFGVGRHGYDDATAPGLGRGELGAAPLGDDGATLRARFDADAGSHDATVNARTAAGAALTGAAQLAGVLTAQLPAAPKCVSLDGDFTLRWQ